MPYFVCFQNEQSTFANTAFQCYNVNVITIYKLRSRQLLYTEREIIDMF